MKLIIFLKRCNIYFICYYVIWFIGFIMKSNKKHQNKDGLSHRELTELVWQLHVDLMSEIHSTIILSFNTPYFKIKEWLNIVTELFALELDLWPLLLLNSTFHLWTSLFRYKNRHKGRRCYVWCVWSALIQDGASPPHMNTRNKTFFGCSHRARQCLDYPQPLLPSSPPQLWLHISCT